MKNMIETFSALGARLLGFGDDDATRAVIDSACRANGWFTPADIRRAVRAIACDMLQREKLEAWLADYPAFRLRSRGACWSSWPEISRLLVFSTCCACL